jgi:hypothetical protein
MDTSVSIFSMQQRTFTVTFCVFECLHTADDVRQGTLKAENLILLLLNLLLKVGDPIPEFFILMGYKAI